MVLRMIVMNIVSLHCNRPAGQWRRQCDELQKQPPECRKCGMVGISKRHRGGRFCQLFKISAVRNKLKEIEK
jgi:predicted Zn-ribbon and HTH transcriptional regulator